MAQEIENFQKCGKYYRFQPLGSNPALYRSEMEDVIIYINTKKSKIKYNHHIFLL
ncbi:hypothetical protein D3C86_2137420 [compost metagenome]